MIVDDRHNEGPANRREPAGARAGRNDGQQRPIADREVPLASPQGGLSASVHAWLDGELPEAAVRKGETAKDVEFWQMIAQETSQMRQLRTPPHVEALIMEALPQVAPRPITPWLRREFVVTPAAVLTSAALLVLATAAATALFFAVTQ